MKSRVVFLIRLAALVSITSGLIGGYVWFVDIVDRSDGDRLRYGFWHNPFMQFHSFNEPFLDISMWVLLACAATIGLGGLMLLAPIKLGAWLVIWQARVSILINGIIVIFIDLIAIGVIKGYWSGLALALRTGSIAVNLTLLKFLNGKSVKAYFAGQSSPDQEEVHERDFASKSR